MPRYKKYYYSPRAILRRLETVIESLTDRDYPHYNIAVDHRIAARALEYWRGQAAGKRRNGEREMESIHFLGNHNVSLDYVLMGKLDIMIRERASGTSSRSKPELRIVD